MPDAGHAQGNTAEMKFEKGLLSDTGALNTDQTIRDGLTDEMRSFMDKGGDDFFNDEGPRQNLIPKIRETILKRMIKENEDSRYDAAITRNKHDEFTKKKMMPLIESFKKTKRKLVLAEAEYDRELEDIQHQLSSYTRLKALDETTPQVIFDEIRQKFERLASLTEGNTGDFIDAVVDVVLVMHITIARTVEVQLGILVFP